MDNSKYRLHPSQLEIYYDQVIDLNRTHYNTGGFIKFNGKIDLPLFVETITALTGELEPFRMLLITENDEPCLILQEKADASIEVIDFSVDPFPEQSADEWIRTRFNTNFEFYGQPLWEQKCLKLSEGEYWYYLKTHHLIIDCYGLRNFIKEVAERYNGRLHGQIAPARAIPSGYFDETAGAISFLKSAAYKKAGGYWLEKFKELPEPLLHIRHVPAEGNRINSQRIFFDLMPSMHSRLRTFCALHGLSLQQLLIGALIIYFRNVSGKNKFIFGSPIHNRDNKRQFDMVGMFAKINPLVFELKGEPTLDELLKAVRRQQLEDFKHSKFAGIHLRQELKKQGYRANENLYDVIVNYVAHDFGRSFKDLPAEIVPCVSQFALTPLSVGWLDFGEERPSRLCVDFRLDYFTAEEIALLVRRLFFVMDQFYSSISQSIFSIAVLPQEERELLTSFNETVFAYPAEKTVVDLFREQVMQRPEAVAVEYEDEQLSYRELEERSNQLAHYLRSLGVGAETLVPICVERGLDMVIGLLGILKAGGAYVPMDPSYPQERIGYMLEDTGAGIVVSGGGSRQVLPDAGARVIVDLTEDREAIEGQPSGKLREGPRAEDLAYVIYTSGSTGRPKGVMIGHGSLTNFLTGIGRELDFAAGSSLLAVTTYSFDISYLELYLPLVWGGKTMLASRETAVDGDKLAGEIGRRQPDYMQATPSGWQVLLNSGWKNREGMKLLVGGEALAEHIKEALTERGAAWNLYGPTETTIWSTMERLDRGKKVSIGRPIANTQVYILDKGGRLCPVGVAGELWIGGAGVARGYWNRAELTAEKFVPKAMREQPGSRLYRTGDLGRWLVDGRIEYLGRLDDQVKIRGYRIEVGEIEQVVLESGMVDQSVVLAREEAGGGKRLVGYVVGEGFEKAALVAYLRSRLPEYMVPGIWVELLALPLTPNGKVDRKGLPEADVAGQLEGQYVAARDATERHLVEIWEELLGVGRIGIHDNFFELGGDSIISFQVVNRARRLGYELASKDLFAQQTIARLCAGLPSHTAVLKPLTKEPQQDFFQTIGIEELEAFMAEEWGGARRRDQVESVYPLSGLQEGMLFHGLYDKGSFAYIEQLTSELVGVKIPLLLLAWEELLRQHTILRSAFYTEHFAAPVQAVYKEVQLPVEELDLRACGPEEREAAVAVYEAKDRQKTFDFGIPPLVRLTLIRLTEERYRMIWTFHHILLDGWSLQVLMGELLDSYKSLLTEGSLPPAAGEDRYEDYIQYLECRNKEEEERYWRNYLHGLEGGSLLPFIQEAAALTSGAGVRNKAVGEYRQELLLLDQKTAGEIERYTRRRRLTVNTVMQGVWAYLLSHYTGNGSVTYGVTSSGRPEAIHLVENRAGLYINTLPLHTTVRREQEIGKWLSELQHDQLQSREYQYTGLSTIQRWLDVPGDLFDTLLVFENYPVNRMLSSRSWPLQIEDIRMQDHNNYPLSIAITASAEIAVLFTYNSALLDADCVRRIKDHFEQVLDEIVSERFITIGELHLITAGEKKLLLEDFNATAVAYPFDKTVVDLFVEQALRTPEAVAVVSGEDRLSYGELDERSDLLALYLRELGVGAETLVPICVERGLEMIVGLLGILKSGGAYVPMEPSYPQERIGYMLEDTSASIVVSSGRARQALPVGGSLVVVDLSEDRATIERQPAGKVEGSPRPGDLAYVIYTSGSTGRPKGVMVEHGSLVNYIDNEQTQYIPVDGTSDRPGSGTYLHLSYTFDASVTALFLPLVRGRSVVMAPAGVGAGELLSAEHLQAGAPYDFIKVTPAHLPLLEAVMVGGGKLTGRLVVGGEALLQHQLHYLIDGGVAVEVINEYGPTEATVGCSTYRLHTHSAEEVNAIKGGRVSIGRPIAGTQLYILDKGGRLCPVGVPGELCIGGGGVARGYLNRAELTAEKFVDDPFGKQPGARLYRTGDVARWGVDGNIEYLGREDEQVKVRGYRIELGEIEQVVLQSGLVDQAVVLAREDQAGSKRLVGYVVAKAGDGTFDRTELMTWLQGRLPEYMVPGIWVELGAFPLTSNGKVDRKGLPDPDVAGQREGEYVAPRDGAEQRLAAIWQELLEVERVGIYDNFFTLGGHSILAIKLVSAINKRLNIELSIAKIFDHPTIAALSEQVSVLLSVAIPDGYSGTRIPMRLDRPSRIPLSYSQERLWFIDQLEGSVQYHVPMVVRLKGVLDVAALSSAFALIVDRHEVLRTVILQEEGAPYQRVLDMAGWRLQVDQTGAGGQEDLQARIAALISTPFDLTRDYKLRVNLIQVGAQEHILVMVTHHIASDGWSVPIIVGELKELYAAYKTGEPSQLPAPEIQYADYAIWQREYLSGALLQEKLQYWEQQLSGVSILHLPTDRVRPQVQSNRGGTTWFRLDEGLTAQLKQLSQDRGTTLFMTLLSAFKVLLYRYSGQQDICVGSAVANRGQHEIQDLVGFFTNALALRSHPGDDQSYLELLEQVRTTTIAAYERQDVPFEKIVSAVVRERDLSRSPLFQVMFDLEHAEFMENDGTILEGVEVVREPAGQPTAKFDMTYSLAEWGGGVEGRAEYSLDLYEEATMVRMAGHYEQVLRSIVADPAMGIGGLRLLTVEEETELLQAFNPSAAVRVVGKTVVDLFVEQVMRTPEATAVVDGEERLSYRELEERSNQLAHYLRGLGVGSETLVPICVERGLEMIVGLLGILKSGGAYVPLEPSYPQERIGYMLEDTSASIVVSSGRARQALPVGGSLVVVDLSEDRATIERQPAGKVEGSPRPGDLAYVIYTSGSTGRPKGVMVEHGSLVNYIDNEQTQYIPVDGTSDRPGSGTYLHLSYTFDASVTALFLPLVRGRSVVMAPAGVGAGELLSAEHLQAGAPYDFIKVTPAHLPLLEAVMVGGGKLTGRLVVGGEALLQHQLHYLIDGGVAVEVINEYGPTEATVGCSTYRLHTHSAEEVNAIKGGRVSIGRPIAGTQLYILDKGGRLCPVGVPGELCIGGGGVARGYLNRAELTAEKFVDDPFGKQPGARLYRTGDVARWGVDGNIEYLGREDEQVKVRGYRIELGEIEQVVLQSGLVDQAVVLAREDQAGSKRLVGYVVAKAGDGTFDRTELMTWLQGRLPEYMVPGIWVELGAFPLTSNGKVDRKGLPDPDVAGQREGEYVAPRDGAEQRLAAIWQELLEVERVGIYDNFFTLGGDSIISIQVVSRARRSGYALQVGDLFTHQTIAGLSAVLLERSGEQAACESEQGHLTGASGLLPIQQWYLLQEQPSVSHFNQSVLLGIDKRITSTVLSRAVQELLGAHDALGFRYCREGSGWRQEYGEGTFVLEREDLSQVREGELGAMIRERSEYYQSSLDIFKGVLVRAVLLETPQWEGQHRLLVVVHHLAVDGVSWRILIEDLSVLLTPGVGGSSPGGKTSSYRQWYEGLVSYGGSSRVQGQREYWATVSSGYRSLPEDRCYDGAIVRTDMGVEVVSLGASLTQQLLQEAPRGYRTEINDLLLAALGWTLVEWSGAEQVTIGLEGHGREDAVLGLDTSRTVGWFTNVYPVRLGLEEPGAFDPSAAGDWVRGVKERLRLVPDKGLGYGVLKYINKTPELQGANPWDLVFNYLGQTDNVVRGKEGLQAAEESTGSSVGKDYQVVDRLSVNGLVRGGTLMLQWSYSRRHYDAETIATLARDYVCNLEAIIVACMKQAALGWIPTPSDFGLTGDVTIRELDKFLSAGWPGGRRGDAVEAIYRLSGLQEGLLFHGLYDKASHAYTEQMSTELVGVQVSLLLRSWEELLGRHSILRSGFYPDQFAMPVQVVYKKVGVPVEELDYRNLSAQERSLAVAAYERHDRERGFDFGAAPLMRLALLRLADDRYRMIWTHHHILLDGWSVQVLVGELFKSYESLVEEGKLPAAVAEDRYEDYIRYLQTGDKEQEERHWREYLSGVEGASLLPFIGATEERNKGVGEYREELLRLDEATMGKVEQYAQQHRLTINTVMQGVWSVLLSRYTGQGSVTYGVTVSGRPEGLRDVESRVGLYINTLPLHTMLVDDAEIADWLSGLQQGQQQSREYQYTALSTIQRWLGVTGDLFDTLLIFENYPVNQVISSRQWSLRAEGTQVKEHTNYPLSMTIAASSDLRIVFTYNNTVLDTEHIKRISNHFEQVLREIVSERCMTVGELRLLTAEEEQELLTSFNETAFAYPVEKTVVDLFREQVMQRPEAVAVEYEDEQLSYRELEERSNQLAHYLRSLGVGAETLVPICVERGLDMVIGLLGILKAGGAYVPMDPSYPQERIGYMLEDTGAGIVVSGGGSRQVLPDAGARVIVDLTEDREAIEGQPSGKLREGPRAEDLAYVIYTSGSTGRPKGVMIGHGSLTNFLTGIGRELDFAAGSSLLAVTTYSFDISYLELYLPLVWGGKTMLASRETAVDGDKLAGEIGRRQPDYMQATPSGWQVLLNSGWKNREGMKLLVGGEALAEHIKEALTERGAAWNLYGPTETTIWSTMERLDRGKKVSIGRPIANTQVYILDKGGRLCPVGVAGELWIGGAGVARGYWNRAELTAEKFVPKAMREQPGSRLYRTGDLGRWLVDGRIEYLGRLDDQVKIRGYRIEVGEIEQVVLESGMVDQSVVLAREEAGGGKRLVGYVVGEGFEKAALVAYLRSRLPEYMVPGIWVELLALPLTPNGKVDRKGLPEADVAGQLEGQYVAARDATERHLVDIWEELLGVGRIGIHDNFFELGGNSLLATRIISAIRRKLEREIGLRELFVYPTIARLAGHVNQKKSGLLLPLITVQERPLRIPLSYSQERLWFIDQLEGSVQYHIPLQVRLRGELDIAALEAAFGKIVDRHEVLRTVILQEEGQPFQQVLNAAGWRLSVEQTATGPQQRITELIGTPFDLTRDYMLRVNLIRVEVREYILVIVLHHIASDGWSLPILVEEVKELYGAYKTERPSRLPALEIQYADYAIWQREHLSGAYLQNKLAYWEKKLSGVSVLLLPTDGVRPPIQSTRGGAIPLRIDRTLSAQLRKLGEENGTTLFMNLLTAFKVLLHRYSGQEDICVGSTIANRGQQEIHGLVGFFVNALALRSDLGGNPSFRELLRQVRTTTLEAYEHQEVPFEKVVEAVVRERATSRSPLFQVLFELQHAALMADGQAVLEGVEAMGEQVSHQTSKFDLTYSLTEGEEGLEGRIEYCLDLYEEATMLRMADHYKQLLNSIVADPECRIGNLGLLTSAEEMQLLEEFKGKDIDYAKDKTVLDLFVVQAANTPEAIAVVCEGSQLSYRELDEKSDQLAHYLITLGLRPETQVPICIERGLEMIIGILGILKAGGVYVPVDPDYPQDRIGYMLEDTSARIVLSSSTSRPRVPAMSQCRLISLDEDWTKISYNIHDSALPPVKQEHLAYVIYTSGSTGNPKGAGVFHRGILNLMQWYIKEFSISGDDRNLIISSIGFDLTQKNIFGTLLAGGSILFAGKGHYDSQQIVDCIRHQRVTIINCAPNAFYPLAEENALYRESNWLRLVILGGEPIHLDRMSLWIKGSGCNCEIVNSYGPTECTDIAAFYRMPHPADFIGKTIPLGGPNNNVHLHILSQWSQLQPIAIVGEICITGHGVGAGYLNDDRLTRTKFKSNPFGEGKIYHTGDLGRWTPDGNVEYLGRRDDQVKIRGYRIEPGEIEQALQHSALVRQAAVVAKSDNNGNGVLTAYVVLQEGANKQAILDYLKEKLPEYMIPSLWVKMERLPLSPNGKIDRKSLPEPEVSALLQDLYMAPRTELEQKLVLIWEKLLAITPVGITNSFFDLGGHSLLATRIASAIRKELQVEFSVRTFFQFPTIQLLAQHLTIQQTNTIVESQDYFSIKL